jgi:hypothetical protein
MAKQKDKELIDEEFAGPINKAIRGCAECGTDKTSKEDDHHNNL